MNWKTNHSFILIGMLLIGIVFSSGCIQQSTFIPPKNVSNYTSKQATVINFDDLLEFIKTYKFKNNTPVLLSENFLRNEKIQKSMIENKIKNFKIATWLKNTQQLQAEAIIFETSDESYVPLAERLFLKLIFVTETCGGYTPTGEGKNKTEEE